jgi:hypothetical protein
MKATDPRDDSPVPRAVNQRTVWLSIGGCVVILLICIFLKFHREAPDSQNGIGQAAVTKHSDAPHAHLPSPPSTTKPLLNAAESVANKVSQFARSRRALAEGMGKRDKIEMPDDVKRFFDAVEAGRWEETDSLFKSFSDARSKNTALNTFWPAILEAYGVAEAAHSWPAQKLLDYGQAVLGSLRPDMVYVGGTDPGRWIPTLLNETSEGEHHIVLTQNGLADATYLDYLDFQYHDKLSTLNAEDSRHSFDDYLSDARKRAEHDAQFPDEPKQLRPGEEIKITDGRVQVSGQVAVMAINEKLLQTLLEKNPTLSFALEESFPLKSTYADAVPNGPLMELRAPDAQSAFTAERATQTIDYWNATTQRLLSDPEAAGSPDTMKSYSHDAMAQANLLAAHNYSAEAEQAYQLASQLWPANPEPVGHLADMLNQQGHAAEAQRLVADFLRNHPEAKTDMERPGWSGSWKVK